MTAVATLGKHVRCLKGIIAYQKPFNSYINGNVHMIFRREEEGQLNVVNKPNVLKKAIKVSMEPIELKFAA